MPITFNSRSTLLFVGDSITDAGRAQDPDGLGFGYVRLVHDYLCAAVPVNAPRVLNMGVSGHKVTDLADRWRRDVIDPSPDVLSIKIGVNDVWHGLHDPHAGTRVDEFRRVYSQLLAAVRDHVPECAVVLCEPTVIAPPVHERGNELMKPYLDVVHELGAEFHVNAVAPLHSAMVIAAKERPDIRWTTDGVHPTSAGHMLIARTWLQVTRNL